MTNLFKDLLKVTSSNVLIALAGIVSGFVVPKIFSLEEYATVASFTLYLSFVGILHFGFIDGIHLKYGGYSLKEIRKNETKTELTFLVILQVVISLLVIPIIYFTRELVLLPVAFSILPINLITFFLFFFQATRQFSFFAIVNISRPLFRLLIVLVMLPLYQLRSPYFLIWGQVAIAWAIFLFLAYSTSNYLKNEKAEQVFSSKNFALIKTGAFIMGGNLLSLLFFSFDRWFVKIFLTTPDFAYYSFAVSMMAVVMLIINSISLTFYPMLAQNKRNKVLLFKLWDALFIVGAYSCVSFFVFKFVILNWLPKYSPSLGIIGITFASLPAITIIKALYVNLFKANKMEVKYFKRVSTMAGTALFLNILAVFIWKTTTAIAIATTLAFFIWLLVSSKDFPEIRLGKKHIAQISIFLLVFYCSAHLIVIENIFIGICVFMTILSITFWATMRDNFLWLAQQSLRPIWRSLR
jgi:O-antigen/teichoic acid export membrane protein